MTSGRRLAFSLIEIMVTVGLLSFIVIGLLSMFTQTQRAFRNSMAQVDVMETGRITVDMLARELEQAVPARVAYVTNRFAVTNFFVELCPGFGDPLLLGLPGTTFQGQPNTQDRRTNVIQRFFFLTRMNQDWVGTGYQVIPDARDARLGTLYRYTVTNRMRGGAVNLSSNFVFTMQNGPFNNLNRIADGVVHLRLKTFDDRGYAIGPFWPTNFASRFNIFRYQESFTNGTPSHTVASYFLSNAVPASLELELGVLEPELVARYRSIGSENALVQLQFLSNHVSQVHLFRQRIPVRNADFSAYQ